MQAEQFSQWQQFTKAMCLHGWPEITDARKSRLLSDALEFVGYLEREPVDGWDGDYGLCDSFHDYFSEYYYTIWSDRDEDYRDGPRYFVRLLSAVIRSGIGFVMNDRGGVLGFYAEDLRRMFDGEIPAWVLARYDGKLTSDVPDDTAIWF